MHPRYPTKSSPPTTPCATPCCRATSCAPATGPAWNRNLGPARPLPAAAQGHDRRHRHPPRHRPRPGQLHHRPRGRPPPAHRRPRRPPARTAQLTCPASSDARSWPRCCPPAVPASAPARSNAPPPATTCVTKTGPNCRPRSPGCWSPSSPRPRTGPPRFPADAVASRPVPARPGPKPGETGLPGSWPASPDATGPGTTSRPCSASSPATCSPSSANGTRWGFLAKTGEGRYALPEPASGPVTAPASP